METKMNMNAILGMVAGAALVLLTRRYVPDATSIVKAASVGFILYSSVQYAVRSLVESLGFLSYYQIMSLVLKNEAPQVVKERIGKESPTVAELQENARIFIETVIAAIVLYIV